MQVLNRTLLIEEVKMKKIIGLLFLGAFLTAGSVFAAPITAEPDSSDLVFGKSANSLTGDIYSPDSLNFLNDLLDSGILEEILAIYNDREDTWVLLFTNYSFDRVGADWTVDFILPFTSLNHDEDSMKNEKWMLGYTQRNTQGAEVPIPGAMLLLGAGLSGLFALRRNSMR